MYVSTISLIIITIKNYLVFAQSDVCCLQCRKYFGYSHCYEFYKSLNLHSMGGWGINNSILIAVDNLLENPAR